MRRFLLLIVSSTLYAQLLAVVHVVNVGQGGNFFNPNNVNANVGDTVRWQWVAGFHNTTSGSIPGGASSWGAPINSGASTFQYVLTVAGTYTYSCTFHAGMNGTLNVASVCNAGNTPVVDAGLPDTICSGSCLQLNATVSNPAGGSLTYQWSPNTNLSNPNIEDPLWCPVFSSPQAFQLIVTNASNGCSDTDQVTIVATMPPSATAPNDTAGCWAGLDTLNLTGDAFPLAVNYLWYIAGGQAAIQGPTTNATAIVAVGDTGENTVQVVFQVSDAYCITRDTMTILTNNLGMPNIVADTVGLMVDFSLDATLPTSSGLVTPSWNFGDGSPAANGITETHTYAQSGSYVVTFMVTYSLSGCSYSVTDTVTVSGVTTLADLASPGVSVRVWPNPAHSTLYVTVEGFISKSIPLQLVDLQGRTVRSFSVLNSGPLAVSLEGVAPGLYSLRGEGFAQRVVVQ